MQTEGWALTRQVRLSLKCSGCRCSSPFFHLISDVHIWSRQRVVKAATSVLGVAADITFEALVISVEVLKLVPNSSLTGAAKTLVIIWEAYQLVDVCSFPPASSPRIESSDQTNRQACLRLTERCAEALLSIHEEVKEAGDDVGEELIRPIAKLNE